MPLEHLAKPFFIDQSRKMSSGDINFAKIQTNKPEHRGSFYNVRYDDNQVNEPMNHYYGAKVSDDHRTFGGGLQLMNEFVTSIVLDTVLNLREPKMFEAPRVLMGIEDDNRIRLFSKMLVNFKSFSRSEYEHLEKEHGENFKSSFVYLGGLMTAMQEVDPNFANYGFAVAEDGSIKAAKIDSNSYFEPRSTNGGIYFNHIKRDRFTEVIGDRNQCNFGALMAQLRVFNSMKPEESPDLIKFVGSGCLEIKKGCEENFKHFMLGVHDFVEMPEQFIDFLRNKLLTEMHERNPTLEQNQQGYVNDSCDRLIQLTKAIKKYFAAELELANQMFPEEFQKETIWNNPQLRDIMIGVTTAPSVKEVGEERLAAKQSADREPSSSPTDGSAKTFVKGHTRSASV